MPPPSPNNKISKEILNDNHHFLLINIFFSNEFENMMLSLINNCIEKKYFLNPIPKFVFLYYFSVICRAKNKENLPLYTRLLKKMSLNSEISNWICKQISFAEFIREVLVENPNRDIKLLIAGIFINVCKNSENISIFLF